MTVADFPRKGLGKCWDCFRGTAPAHDGHDTPPNFTPAPARRSGRVVGF